MMDVHTIFQLKMAIKVIRYCAYYFQAPFKSFSFKEFIYVLHGVFCLFVFVLASSCLQITSCST